MYGAYCRLAVPVWASRQTVVRVASRKMLKKSVRYARKHREARHAFLRAMLQYHHESQQLCREFHL